jgi:hypothetical protein
MKIELKFPFSEQWEYGYLVNGNDGRRRVLLYKNGKQDFGLSYAKYLKSIELGRILSPAEEVDHKDEDKTNDDPNNLQVLTKTENIRKSHEHRTRTKEEEGFYTEITCANPNCTNLIKLTPGKLKDRDNQRGCACSRECAASLKVAAGIVPPSNSSSEELISQIKKLGAEGKTAYAIGKALGISQNTAAKYLKL